MTALLAEPLEERYGWSIFSDFDRIDCMVSYILSKYGLACSALALALWSLTVDTSFIAFVICCVL